MQNIVWLREFPKGRMANAVFEFMFARYIEKKISCKVVIGSAKNPNLEMPKLLLNLSEDLERAESLEQMPNLPCLTLGEARDQGPAQDVARIKNHFERNPGTVLAIDGYFQYDTNFIFEDPEYTSVFLEKILPLKPASTTFQEALHNYQKQLEKIFGSFLIAIHVRRGDYLFFSQSSDALHPVFYPSDLNAILTQIEKIILNCRVKKPLVYVASDDIEYCKNFFSERTVKIITRDDLLLFDNRNELSELMVDIAALTCSEALIASNSTLSILASMLNQKGKIFLRQTRDGDVLPFHPLHTAILFGQ